MLAHVATIDAESCVHIDNFRLCRVATSGGVAESQSDADLARCVVESRMKPFETAKIFLVLFPDFTSICAHLLGFGVLGMITSGASRLQLYSWVFLIDHVNVNLKPLKPFSSQCSQRTTV
jgi:hypothetical protein